MAEVKYSFSKKEGFFNTKEIKGLFPCKYCGEQPLMNRKENKDGEYESNFFCSCHDGHESGFIGTLKLAINIWNMKNRISAPTGKTFSLLNIVGIAMNHNTFWRFARWKRSNITSDQPYNFITELSNGLKIFVSKDIQEDTVKLVNKTDMKNILTSVQASQETNDAEPSNE